MKGLLFLRNKSISEWRACAQTTHCARWERLIAQADSYLEYLPPAEHPRETITYIGMAVANLALAYRLSDDRRYLDLGRAWIATAIRYPHWGMAHMPDHDLDASWLLFGLGLGYAWLGESLAAEERDALRAKLCLQGSRLYDFAVATEGQWWSSAYWQNHNWICYAGLATVACALGNEYAETQAWWQRAVDNFRTVFALLPEDGSDYEGVVYWCYGLPWLLIAADLIQQQSGLDLHTSAFLRNTFYYRLYASAPDLVATANFGDCHDRRSAHAPAIYYRLASAYRNGHAQWLADHFEKTGEWERERRQGLLRPSSASHAFLEFLWFDPAVDPVPIDVLPTARVLPDLGLLSTRRDWSGQATFFAFKCGKPNGEKAWAVGHAPNRERGGTALKTGHAHPDENSFLIVRGADYLAVDEGYSQKKQSCHHTVVLVDGQGQYREGGYDVAAELGEEWGGCLQDTFVSEQVVYARGEAAGAYDPKLTLERFTRQILVIDHQYVVVSDDLVSREPRRFDWLLQTDVPMSMAEGSSRLSRVNSGRRFHAVGGSSRLDVAVIEPADITADSIKQEIVAYPSASTPEWVLRHWQHTLRLTPPRTTAARFLVVLSVDDANAPAPAVTPLKCQAGSAVSIQDYVVAFARDANGIVIEDIETDANWIVFNRHSGKIAAGNATRVVIARRAIHRSPAPKTCSFPMN